MFLENLKIALTAISANKVRSILTVLGVMVGVAAVIAVVSLVQGLQHRISSDLESVGSTFIRVMPDFTMQRNPFLGKKPELTYDDAAAVRRGTTAVRNFTPIFMASAEAKNAESRHDTTLLGVSQSYQDVTNQWVDQGRFFTHLDEESKKRVCVVGPELARALTLDDPIGKVIHIDQNGYTIVGVMEKRGSSITGDLDDMVYVPFTTAAAVYGPERMKQLSLLFQVRQHDDIDQSKEQVTEILRSRHHLAKAAPNDFRIDAQEEILKTITTVLTNVSVIMAAVVGIALLVGGIGIMNIMLVSVTERTREIGVRKAIGARRHDVLVQFLIEAVALSGVGGVIGIAGGYAIANVIRFGVRSMINLPAVHTPLWAIVLAFGFCGLLGTIFGIYPAARASQLDPIEALRYE